MTQQLRRLPMFLFIFLSVTTLLPRRASAANAWETISEKDGVTVERRQRPGSSFYELRASARCEVAPKIFFNTVWNYREFPKFMPYLKKLEVLKEDEESGIVYEEVGMPLVANRDYTLRFTKQIDAQTNLYEVDFESADSAGPPPGNSLVRAQNIKGSWVLEPTDGGKATLVTYAFYSEPGGSLPSWLVNVAQKDAPRDVLLAMINRVLKGGR